MPAVRLRNIILDPTPVGGSTRWGSAVNVGVTAANRIFRQIGITVEEASRHPIVPEVSQRLLTQDLRELVAGAETRTSRQEYRQQMWHMLEQQGTQYSLRIAVSGQAAVGLATGVVDPEALSILDQFRSTEVLVVWVARMATPGNASGHTVCSPFYDNLPNGVEGIFMNAHTGDHNTLAHELGHLLMHAGHCADPAAHIDTCECANGNPSNLMYWDGSGRSPSPTIAATQATRIRASAYVTGP